MIRCSVVSQTSPVTILDVSQTFTPKRERARMNPDQKPGASDPVLEHQVCHDIDDLSIKVHES
jgi:hypothetical protein